MNDANPPWWKDQLTHIPTYQKVQSGIEGLVRTKYSGWRDTDQDDLVAAVLVKYLKKFGKDTDRLDEDEDGEAVIPLSWLRRVVTTTATDLHRKKLARPAHLVGFDEDDSDQDWDIVGALGDLRTPSLITARGFAAQRALDLLREADRELIQSRIIEQEDLISIAERTGKSYEATKKAVQHAVGRLRKVAEANPELMTDLLDRPAYPIE